MDAFRNAGGKQPSESDDACPHLLAVVRVSLLRKEKIYSVQR
jgi:hypothetical protein